MKKNFQELEAQTSLARERLKNAIRALPDSADGVKMLAPNCGVVSSSLIAKNGFNLSAHYYLSRETKKVLLELVDSNRTIEALVESIEAVLTTGKLKCTGYTETIAPNVLEALKKAWEGKAEDKTFGERYGRFLGAIKDLPSDLAAQHEHYRLGKDKRDDKGNQGLSQDSGGA